MWKTTAALGAVVLGLTACAAFNNVESDVSPYSNGPTGGKPATYFLARLRAKQAR